MPRWGKNQGATLVLQYWNGKTWVFVEDVGLNGAGRKCRSMAKKTGVRHRVFDTSKNEVFCECG